MPNEWPWCPPPLHDLTTTKTHTSRKVCPFSPMNHAHRCAQCLARASPGWVGTAAHGTSRCLAHDARDGARPSSVHLVVAPSPFSHKPEGFSLPPQCPGPGTNTPLFVIDSESVLQLVDEACGTWWHAAVAISALVIATGTHCGYILSGATAAARSCLCSCAWPPPLPFLLCPGLPLQVCLPELYILLLVFLLRWLS